MSKEKEVVLEGRYSAEELRRIADNPSPAIANKATEEDELPDLDTFELRELLDDWRLCAGRPGQKSAYAALLAHVASLARRAQPEGEAPQAVPYCAYCIGMGYSSCAHIEPTAQHADSGAPALPVYAETDSGMQIVEPGTHVNEYHHVDDVRAALAAQQAAAPGNSPEFEGIKPSAPGTPEAPARQPELAVWYGAMPESNGKSNFTAILKRKDAGPFDTCHITIDRSEYPDRVRYEADRVRWLIGEIEEEPFILDYDAEKHSGYGRAAQLDGGQGEKS